MSEFVVFSPPTSFLSLEQSHSNQQCNWNATPIWRKGNFWQEEIEQLGVLFRIYIDSHSS